MRLPNVFSFRILRAVALAVLTWALLAWAAARALIVDDSHEDADAIVVLSGSSTYIERTTKAAELYREGRAPVIVLTDDHTRGGWSSARQTNPYFVERAQEELTRQGVPRDKITVAPGIASGTRDEAMILRDYSSAQGFRSILVVTSAYHSRRARRTLQQSFSGTGTAVGMAPVPTGGQTPAPAFWWLHIEGWRSVGSEYGKLIYYWMRYG